MPIYSTKPKDYSKAGPSDHVVLEALPGSPAPIVERNKLDMLVSGIVSGGRIHVSGETGTAKTLTIRTLLLNRTNFHNICKALGVPKLPLSVYSCSVALVDGPPELAFRRSIKDGTTFDEDSTIVQALKEQDGKEGKEYAAILLPELGRTHSEAVQSALVDMITDAYLLQATSQILRVGHVAWVADSNYADQEGLYTLVAFDDALRRRFNVNLSMNHPVQEQECAILGHLVSSAPEDEIARIVALGSKIRQKKKDGALQSVPPPTLYGYAEFLRMHTRLPHVPVDTVAFATILGHCSDEDRSLAGNLLSTTHGVAAQLEDQGEEGDAVMF